MVINTVKRFLLKLDEKTSPSIINQPPYKLPHPLFLQKKIHPPL